MKTRPPCTLDRHENEGHADYVQRILVDPMTPTDATDVELSEWLRAPVSVVREQRSRQLALREALEVAEDIGWEDDVYSLIRAALVDYSLGYCAAKCCTHPKCRTPLLAELAERGVSLKLVDGDKFVSEPRRISDTERSWIVERRSELVSELRFEQAVPETSR